MNTIDRPIAGRSARIGTALAWLAAGAALACGAVALLAGPGYRLELLSLGAGLQAIRWAATGAIGGAIAAVLALRLLLQAGVRRRRWIAVAALALNALVAGPPLYLYWTVQRLPHIHDISTDTADPPAFVAVVPLRAAARNPVDYKPATAAEQKRAYPDIVPLVLADAPDQAFEYAERSARAMGWQIVSIAPDERRIEATDTSLLFGFKDDVVIRVRPLAQGSVVDVRSLSRVGGSDIGVNAKRVRAFLRQLAAQQ